MHCVMAASSHRGAATASAGWHRRHRQAASRHMRQRHVCGTQYRRQRHVCGTQYRRQRHVCGHVHMQCAPQYGPPPSSRPACGGSGASGTPVAGLQAPAVALAVGLRLRCCTSSQQRHTRQLSMSSHHSLGRERGSVGRLGMASPLHLRRISWHLLYISLGSRAPASRSRFLACSFTLAFLLATSCSFAFLARSRLF